ncbi:outer membrane beta-barrel protein [Aureivirga sp. CE67]|uniref:outer membrane beta-barrel protein n=1 Tax=Aureivirga sp. CE67 TaxID=1788983 RepID=UPI0018CAB89E|nr:outer membrane beta-barrel protein [Aureivirga sp. CE67]
MKRKTPMKLLIILITILSFQTINAQFYNGGAFFNHADYRFGVKAGINIYTLNTDVSSTSPGLGWNVGFTSNYIIGEYFEISSGLEFQKSVISVKTVENNYHNNNDDDLKTHDTKFRMLSFMMPFKLNYVFLNKDDELLLRVNAGGILNLGHGFEKADSNEGYEYFEEEETYGGSLESEQPYSLFWTVGLEAEYKKMAFNVDYSRNLSTPYLMESSEGFLAFSLKYYFTERY